MSLRTTTSFFLLAIATVTYATASSVNTPKLFTKTFDFISVGDSISTTAFTSDVDFMKKGRKEEVFKTCNDILVYDYKNIATYEQFRFKLVTATCTAIYKYLNAKDFKYSFFPSTFSNSFIVNLPAHITPIINNHTFNKQKKLSLNQAYNIISTKEKNKSTNILTKTDEFYIDILARGDFNDDGIEDLLVSSQWYARNARGKYNDLVILSKLAKDKPIKVTWRMNGSNW